MSLADLIAAQPGVIVHWPLNDGGSSAHAAVGGPSGVCTGTVVFSANLTAPLEIPTLCLGGYAVLNPASDLSGTGNYIISDGIIPSGSAGAIEIWVWPLDAHGDEGYYMMAAYDQLLHEDEDSPAIPGPSLAIQGPGRQASGAAWSHRGPSLFSLYDENYLEPEGGVLLPDQWNHVVFKWSGGTETMYLNGENVGTAETHDAVDPGRYGGSLSTKATLFAAREIGNFNIGGNYTIWGTTNPGGYAAAYSNLVLYDNGDISDADVLAHYRAGICADHTLTVSGLSADNKSYDGGRTATVHASSPSLVGVAPGDDVHLVVGSLSGTFVTADIGSGKLVNVSGLSLAGADASHYTLSPTAHASITTIGLSVTGVTAVNKVFDHTTLAAIDVSHATLHGVLSGDTVTLNTGSATGHFADSAIGDGKLVAVSGLFLEGANAGNYSLAQPTTAANITRVPSVRVTQVFLEALEPDVASGKVRVTQSYLEVLGSDRERAFYNVNATTGLWAGVHGSGTTGAPPNDTGGAGGVDSVGVGSLPGTYAYARAATTGLRLGSTGSENAEFAESAATSLYAGDAATETVLTTRTATTGLFLGSVASEVDLPIVHATTGLWVGSTGDTKRIYTESATTELWAGSGARQRTYDSFGAPLIADHDVAVDATTGLWAGLSTVPTVTQVYFKSSSTGLRFGLAAASPNSISVHATTGIAFRVSDLVDEVDEVIHFVSATTGLRLGHRGAEEPSVQIAVRALTGLTFTHDTETDEDHIYRVRATTSMRLGSAGAEFRDLYATAATAVDVGHAQVRGREIHVSAVTGFMAGSGDLSNEFIAKAATTAIRWTHAAHLVVAGIETETGLAFGHLATAEVWLPWRRADLTLDPGGQIPH